MGLAWNCEYPTYSENPSPSPASPRFWLSFCLKYAFLKTIPVCDPWSRTPCDYPSCQTLEENFIYKPIPRTNWPRIDSITSSKTGTLQALAILWQIGRSLACFVPILTENWKSFCVTERLEPGIGGKVCPIQ